ncbi:MAG: LysR family transcriptional regulator [Hyphomicrobiales bacterium]|nr:LysR family transcriptional regulator [Hyphomicrobiales bacterium]MCP5370259.1 LysR family transcriptional regulator [Hyphomicrobiales bacterium]
MNLRQLEIFAAVMRSGTTIGAAKILNVTQPAVSVAIKHLEGQLKVELFQRKHGRLIPTEEAKIMYEGALSVFEAFEATKFTVERLKDAQIGTLRVACSSSLAETLLPIALKSFNNEFPDVKIKLSSGTVEYVWRCIESGEADVAFFYSDPDIPTLSLTRISRVEMICAIPASNKLVENEVIRAKDLAGQKMISLSKREWFGPIIASTFESSDVLLENQVEVRFLHLAQRLVSLGLGIAIIDSFQIFNSKQYESIVYRRFEPHIAATLYAAYSNTRPLPNVARRFIDVLIGCLSRFEQELDSISSK